jgi:protease-4
MKEFIKYTLATIVGIFIASILLFFLSVGLIGAMISAADKPVSVQSNSVLYFKIDKPIPDRTSNNPWDNFNYSTFTFSPQAGLNDILENIEKAKTDENIKGIFIETGLLSPGIATMEEIRNALISFKESGKFIICYSESIILQSAYYLASVADKIYLNPAALMEFFGLRSEIIFYKGALEKLGIDVQIFRHGKFKSAVEPYTQKKMSMENREQILTYVGAIWNYLLMGISKERDISIEELNKFADNLTINNSQAASDNKLIDSLKYRDEILNELKELSGIAEKKNVRFISMTKYSKTPKKRTYKGLPKNKIALIYASGIIGFGEGSESSIGSAKLSQTIRKARLDTTIKAIVLRINSPGGNAMSSEIIWREVFLAQQSKPLVASLGNVAASGGYYIVSPADTIVASPTTITGSIGVFGIFPNTQKLFNDKLGITFDVAKTNKHSDFGAIYRPLNAPEKEYLQKAVEKTYDIFISHVAEGRNMTKETVDSIGQGRVWSGKHAKDIGLVDVFGGMNKAIEIAAEMAYLEQYRIVSLPRQIDPYQKLLKDLSGDVKLRILQSEMGESYRHYKNLREIIQAEGVQMRLPYSIEIY